MPTVEFEYFNMLFEWDDKKEELILQQHGINFRECCSVFLDENEVTIPDTRFDDDEQRYLTIGLSNQARLLVVAWTYRNKTRIITARKAEKQHENRYNSR